MKSKRAANINELLIVEIMRTSEVINHRVNGLLKGYELTNPQYNILRILRGAEGNVTVGQIKERMLFSTSDVSRLLDRLVLKKLIHREVCPSNRRKMDVGISQVGLKVLQVLDREMARTLDEYYVKKIPKKTAQEIIEQLRLITGFEEDKA